MDEPKMMHSSQKVSAIMLAAGGAVRMGECKQLIPIQGKCLVKYAFDNVLASVADEIIVAVGSHADETVAALGIFDDERVKIIRNDNWAQGQSTSVKAGLEQCLDSDGAIFCLADMPFVSAETINGLIDLFKRKRETEHQKAAAKPTAFVAAPSSASPLNAATSLATTSSSADASTATSSSAKPSASAPLSTDPMAAASLASAPLIVAPFCGAKRGNPVVFSRELFPEIMQISGDSGPGALIKAHAENVVRMEADASVLQDIDVPSELRLAEHQLSN